MSPKMSLAAVCAALFVLCCGIGMAQDLDIKLTAEPDTVTEGVTKDLTLTCRPSPAMADEGRVGVVMRLFRVNGSDEMHVATATQSGQVIAEDESATYSGHIRKADEEKETFLSVSFPDPTFSEEGLYLCRFVFMDPSYVVHKITASVNVTVEEQPTVPPPTVKDEVPEVHVEEVVVNFTRCNCDEVMDEVKDLKATLIMENQLLKREVQKYDESCRASFTARKSENSPMVSGVTLTFDDVINNKGQAFDQTSFVAPCTGQYFFSLTLRSHQNMEGGYVDGLIQVDGEEVARTSVFIAFATMNYQSATNGAVVSLEQGQKVNVKVMTTSQGNLIGSTHTVFSGFYLYP